MIELVCKDRGELIAEIQRWIARAIQAEAKLNRIESIVCEPTIDRPGVVAEPTYATRYKFQATWCSQCGEEFGPGDHGYSHCENHAGRIPVQKGSGRC